MYVAVPQTIYQITKTSTISHPKFSVTFGNLAEVPGFIWGGVFRFWRRMHLPTNCVVCQIKRGRFGEILWSVQLVTLSGRDGFINPSPYIPTHFSKLFSSQNCSFFFSEKTHHTASPSMTEAVREFIFLKGLLCVLKNRYS